MSSSRKCICCNEKYFYCPSCGKDRLKPSWYATFCSEDCKDLWQSLSRFNMNKITKAEAKEIISNLNLKPKEEYVACVQRDLENILKPKRGKRVEVKPVEAPIVEPVEIEETPVTEIIEEATLSHEVVNEE